MRLASKPHTTHFSHLRSKDSRWQGQQPLCYFKLLVQWHTPSMKVVPHSIQCQYSNRQRYSFAQTVKEQTSRWLDQKKKMPDNMHGNETFSLTHTQTHKLVNLAGSMRHTQNCHWGFPHILTLLSRDLLSFEKTCLFDKFGLFHCNRCLLLQTEMSQSFSLQQCVTICSPRTSSNLQQMKNITNFCSIHYTRKKIINAHSECHSEILAKIWCFTFEFWYY